MAKVHFQQQSEHSECGLACVAMLIDFFKSKTRLTELRDIYGVPTGGYNFLQMVQILKEHKLNSKAIKAKFEDLSLLPTPFIVYWNAKHFVIVEKIGRNIISITDPALGKLKVSKDKFEENYSGYALYVTNKKQKRLQAITLNPELVDSLNSSKYNLFGVILTSLAMQAFSLLLPALIQRIIDGNLKFSPNSFWALLSFFLLLFALYFITNMGRIRLITNLQTSFDKNLLSLTIHRLLGLPYSYFTNRSKGELIYRINSNSYIRQILIDNVIGSVTNLLFFVIYLVALFYVNILLAIVTLIIAIIILLFSVMNAKINQVITQKEVATSTRTQEITSELINNIFTIKATNSQRKIYSNWVNNFDKQIEIEKEKAKYSSVLLNIPQALQAFYPLIIIFIGYLLIGNNQITIGGVIAFNAIGVAFLAPMMSVIEAYSQLLIVRVYLERLLDIIEATNELSLFGNREIVDVSGRIELKNVSYRYSKFSDLTLSNISLKILPREKVAIVGPSGSGKSTLLQIISGLYRCTSGLLKYDDINIDDINTSSLRKHLGIVLQEHDVFNGTIRDNIAMERDYSSDEIWYSLKQVELDTFVSKLPIGLETHISESGNNISGGQSQKLSLARTIIAKPRILLLDEPTSSLDNISETIIMDNLFKMDATVVVIAHRLSTIENFDKIIVMDAGEIVGMGTHKQLLETNELYETLYKRSTT